MLFVFHATTGYDVGPPEAHDLGLFTSFEGAKKAVDAAMEKLGAPSKVVYVGNNDWEWAIDEHEKYFRILRREVKP